MFFLKKWFFCLILSWKDSGPSWRLKIIFVKQCFTTKFYRRDTDLLTKIATVQGVWTPTFSMFFKNVWNFDFQNLFMQFTFTRKFQKAMFLTRFDSFLTPFWLHLVTKTLVLPEEQKIIFENQVSTTEFRHRDTALLTKIANVLGPEHPLFSVCKNILFFPFQ